MCERMQHKLWKTSATWQHLPHLVWDWVLQVFLPDCIPWLASSWQLKSSLQCTWQKVYTWFVARIHQLYWVYHDKIHILKIIIEENLNTANVWVKDQCSISSTKEGICHFSNGTISCCELKDLVPRRWLTCNDDNLHCRELYQSNVNLYSMLGPTHTYTDLK